MKQYRKIYVIIIGKILRFCYKPSVHDYTGCSKNTASFQFWYALQFKQINMSSGRNKTQNISIGFSIFHMLWGLKTTLQLAQRFYIFVYIYGCLAQFPSLLVGTVRVFTLLRINGFNSEVPASEHISSRLLNTLSTV